MGVTKMEVTAVTDETTSTTKKYAWYWGAIYLASWLAFFYIGVVPSYNGGPRDLYISDEPNYPDHFIGERAQLQLLNLSSIGVKLTGTVENEELALNFLRDEVEKIRASARNDLYDIEVDIQYSSGSFMLWTMPTSYHNVVNFVVKLSPKNTQSENYLLLNSHFDSEVDTPAAGDDGIMVVVMLETLRVISRSEKQLKNPIVFLFNGAEESNLLASHGFITQHKWRKNCKALINLDSAGSGGREVLFQSGPNHPWMMKHYQKNVKYPLANTIAEELFQNGFIPSDTDFRIFRDYGGVPGLDMAHTLNGYIYHTKYDTFSNVHPGTYQLTGSNILSLTWAMANAEEMDDTAAHEEGHTIFYDYMGWFTLAYTEGMGIFFNLLTSAGAWLTIGLGLRSMIKKEKNTDSTKKTWYRALIILALTIGSQLLAVGYVMLVAAFMTGIGFTETWYSEGWLIVGLYYFPVFMVVGWIPALYVNYTKNKTAMPLSDTIICFWHSHLLLLSLVCVIMTAMGIRSSYFPMMAMFFFCICETVRKLVALSLKFDLKWIWFMVGQIAGFWFFAYVAYVAMLTFVPMQGRSGPTSTPDFMIATSSALIAIQFTGFIMPVVLRFHKAALLCSVFGILNLLTIIIAVTPVGFPYKADVAPQRFYVLHTNRIIHDANDLVIKNESGFYVQPVDTRPTSLDDTTLKMASPPSWIDEACDSEMFCGLPLYSTRWNKWKNSARWVPAASPNLLIPVELNMFQKLYDDSQTRIRYSFTLKAADRMVIYVQPYPGVKVLDWSFDRTPLDDDFVPPYFIYHCYSMDDTPLEFWIEVERSSSSQGGKNMRLGVGAHYLYHKHAYTTEYKDFLETFPDWSYAINWFASYESWHF